MSKYAFPYYLFYLFNKYIHHPLSIFVTEAHFRFSNCLNIKSLHNIYKVYISFHISGKSIYLRFKHRIKTNRVLEIYIVKNRFISNRLI